MKLNEALLKTKNRKKAIIFNGIKYTYETLITRYVRFAHGLKSLGLKRGDVVLFLDLEGIIYMDTLFACSALGLTMSMMDFQEQYSETSMKRINPKLILYEKSLLKNLGKAGLLKEIPLMEIGSEKFLDLFYKKKDFGKLKEDGDENDLIGVSCTNGSTSKPKMIPMTHKSIIWGCMDCLRFDGAKYTDDEKSVVYTLSHRYGYEVLIFHIIHEIDLEFVDPDDFLKSISDNSRRITNLIIFGDGFKLLLGNKFPENKFKRVWYCGFKIKPIILENLMKLYPNIRFQQAYGSSEIGGASKLTPEDHIKKKTETHEQYWDRLHSAGKPLKGREILIVDQDTLQEKKTGEIGEILVRSISVFPGYLGHTEEQKKKYFCKDGYFRSNDAGIIDKNGYLTIVGRIGNVIVTGDAHNIYGSEIENAVMKMKGLVGCICFGLAIDIGQIVSIAVIVSGKISKKDVADHCKEFLPEFKVPERIFFVDSFPKSGHKVSRKKLQEIFKLK